MIAMSARAAPSSGGAAGSPGVSASSSQSERCGMGRESTGLSPLMLASTLAVASVAPCLGAWSK